MLGRTAGLKTRQPCAFDFANDRPAPTLALSDRRSGISHFRSIGIDRELTGPIEVLPFSVPTVDGERAFHAAADVRRSVHLDRATHECVREKRRATIIVAPRRASKKQQA